jgi:hypothetical protein
LLKFQSARDKQGNNGDPSDRFAMVHKTRGSEIEDDLMWQARVRLRALIIARKGQ